MKKRSIALNVLVAVRTATMQEDIDLVAGDFNGASWRHKTGPAQQCDSSLDLPTIVGPGGILHEGTDVCGGACASTVRLSLPFGPKMITENRAADFIFELIKTAIFVIGCGTNFLNQFKTLLEINSLRCNFVDDYRYFFSCGTFMDVGSCFFHATSLSYLCCVLDTS